MKWPLLFALGSVLHTGLAVRDIDGVVREPLRIEKGHIGALFFVTNDCPISNYYSREIRRICEDYSNRGVGCALVYSDKAMTDSQAREHARDYGHGDYPRIVDRKHELVKATGAAINPTAVLVNPDGAIVYRGRVDNAFAAIGKQRRVITQHDVRDALDAVLAGRPVLNPQSPPLGCYIE